MQYANSFSCLTAYPGVYSLHRSGPSAAQHALPFFSVQLVQRLGDGFSHVALVVRLHVLSLTAAHAAPLYSTRRRGGDTWTMRRFSPRSSLGSPFTSTSYATSIRVASVCAT